MCRYFLVGWADGPTPRGCDGVRGLAGGGDVEGDGQRRGLSRERVLDYSALATNVDWRRMANRSAMRVPYLDRHPPVAIGTYRLNLRSRGPLPTAEPNRAIAGDPQGLLSLGRSASAPACVAPSSSGRSNDEGHHLATFGYVLSARRATTRDSDRNERGAHHGRDKTGTDATGGGDPPGSHDRCDSYTRTTRAWLLVQLHLSRLLRRRAGQAGSPYGAIQASFSVILSGGWRAAGARSGRVTAPPPALPFGLCGQPWPRPRKFPQASKHAQPAARLTGPNSKLCS
jgi:hypothetical protein